MTLGHLKKKGKNMVMEPAGVVKPGGNAGDAEAQFEFGTEMVRVGRWMKANQKGRRQ